MSSCNLIIDNEKCVHCGKCIADCGAYCLEFDENNVPTFSEGAEARCIKCQHCLAVCPTGALSILGKKAEDSQPTSGCNAEELLNLIKSRRSIRTYKQQNLDKDKLDKIKDVLKWTPTGCNFHQLDFAFVDDIEVMNEIRNTINSRLIKCLESTCFNTFAKKFTRYKQALLNGHDVIFRGAPHMVVVSTPINAPCVNVDPMIALSYLELYAQSLGVGTLWCGLGYYCFKLFPDLCEQIEVPEGYKVSYVMLFGEKDVDYPRVIQPDDISIHSVKLLGNRKMPVLESIKHFILNIIR